MPPAITKKFVTHHYVSNPYSCARFGANPSMRRCMDFLWKLVKYNQNLIYLLIYLRRSGERLTSLRPIYVRTYARLVDSRLDPRLTRRRSHHWGPALGQVVRLSPRRQWLPAALRWWDSRLLRWQTNRHHRWNVDRCSSVVTATIVIHSPQRLIYIYYYLFRPVISLQEGCKVLWWVCLSVCLFSHHSRNSKTTQPYSIRYVLLVLWMSCFHTFAPYSTSCVFSIVDRTQQALQARLQ